MKVLALALSSTSKIFENNDDKWLNAIGVEKMIKHLLEYVIDLNSYRVFFVVFLLLNIPSDILCARNHAKL